MSEMKGYVTHLDKMGSIHISEEVLAAIASEAVMEVEGIGGLAVNQGIDIAEFLGMKPVRRGIHLQIADEKIEVGIAILVLHGSVIPDVAKAVQETVANSIEATSGLAVESVNVSVAGVVFEKEPKKA